MRKGILHYRIAAPQSETRLFQITLQFHVDTVGPLHFQLPNWIPGSYLIRNFAKSIQNVQAFSEQKSILIQKTNKNTWITESTSGAITITYRFYAGDLSVRGAHLDDTHAYFNGAVLFLKWLGPKTSIPCSLEILPMQFPAKPHAAIEVATTLDPLQITPDGFGEYLAADYDELIDHPVEIGNFEALNFDVLGIPHKMILSGLPSALPLDRARLTRDLQSICEEHLALFGQPYPITQYQFLLQTLKSGYGGLEHRSSCSLFSAWADLPLFHERGTLKPDYRKFLGLVSHEYFHTWNIKQIKPEAFVPYDLNTENYTSELWIYEGITSYYDDLALVRSGVISEEDYFKMLGEIWTRLYRTPGRLHQSLAESSFDTWIKFYQPNENSVNAEVSYYNKGAVIAALVDLKLRTLSKHRYSLDDIMAQLWEHHGRTGIGVPEGRFAQLVEKLTPEARQEWQLFWEETLRQPLELSVTALEKLWETFGVAIRFRVSEGVLDAGGTPPTSRTPDELALSTQTYRLGIVGSLTPEGYKVRQVLSGSAAEKAGIAPQDILLALNDRKIDTDDLDSYIRFSWSNEPVTCHFFRRDLFQTRIIQPDQAPLDTVYFELLPNADPTQHHKRHGWLAPRSKKKTIH